MCLGLQSGLSLLGRGLLNCPTHKGPSNFPSSVRAPVSSSLCPHGSCLPPSTPTQTAGPHDPQQARGPLPGHMSLLRAGLPPPRHAQIVAHTPGPMATDGSSKTRFGLQLYPFLLWDLAAFPVQPTKHANDSLITLPLPDHTLVPPRGGFSPGLLLHACQRVAVSPRAGHRGMLHPPRSPSHRPGSAHRVAPWRGPFSICNPRARPSGCFPCLPSQQPRPTVPLPTGPLLFLGPAGEGVSLTQGF